MFDLKTRENGRVVKSDLFGKGVDEMAHIDFDTFQELFARHPLKRK